MRLTRLLCTAGVITLGAIGIQLVATQAASAHTPNASITCTTWTLGAQYYETAQHNTYGYSVDGATEVTGSFTAGFIQSGTFNAGSGNHTLIAHVYQNNDPAAQYSKTYNLSTSGCAMYLPIPAAPLPTAPTCSEAGAATIPPDTDTVHWSLSGNVATATAKGSNQFSDGTTTKSFTENVLPKLNPDSDNCATHVTAPAPAFANGDCDTAPTLSGATEASGYTVVIDGTPGFGNTVTVTFTAKPNFRLDGQTVYPFHYAAKPDCLIDVSPAAPAVVQSVCTGPGTTSMPTVTPVDTIGIVYMVSADLSIVTATPSAGYTLGQLPTGWILQDGVAVFHTSLVSPGDCTESVVPIASTFTDDRCESSKPTGSSLTLPEITGADYFVDGLKTAAGTHPATDGSTVTITVQAQDGYTLTGTTSWSHTFGKAPTCAGTSALHITPLPTVAPATTVPLASTGVASMSLLLIAGLLAVVGGALCIGGIDRRRSRS